MDKRELARTIAARWMRVLSGPLEGKGIVIRFLMEGYFPDDWVTASWKSQCFTRESYVTARARPMKQGKPIPDGEIREAVLKNKFDSVEVTVFSVPERNRIPSWVEEEYFTRGILRALLQVRYPDWTEQQRTEYEERLVGKRHLRSISIPKAIFYTGLLTLAVLVINMSTFWVFGWLSGEEGLMWLCFAIAIEGAFMVIYAITTFSYVTDMTIYGPTGRRFYEHLRYPPRPTAAIVFSVSGILLILIGLLTCPPI